jgi:hypothetical protein
MKPKIKSRQLNQTEEYECPYCKLRFRLKGTLIHHKHWCNGINHNSNKSQK